MSTPPLPIPAPPSWPHCGYGADPTTDPLGCIGIHVTGSTACLAHLTDPDRTTYLATLAPGARIDHRGTPFTESLLISLLEPLRDATTQLPHIHDASFEGAQFAEDAVFQGVKFSGDVRFDGAQFLGEAIFDLVTFSGNASFHGTQFSEDAEFNRTQFSSLANFSTAQFGAYAWFKLARFGGHALFGEAHFSARANFAAAEFSRAAVFRMAHFSEESVFDMAHFAEEAEFSETHIGGEAGFDKTRFGGAVSFDRAQFDADANFEEAQFGEAVSFGRARFEAETTFEKARFDGAAGFYTTHFTATVFDEVQFSGETVFSGAFFAGEVRFDRAQFSGGVGFGHARFLGDAAFEETHFAGEAVFSQAQFSDLARFGGARFTTLAWFGPFVAARGVGLSGAIFEAPVTLEIAAPTVSCVRTRWNSTATLRLRHAIVNLKDAVLSAPVAVTAHPTRFTVFRGAVDEGLLTGSPDVRVASVQGVDAAHLVLTDIDLSDCLFAGAFHLDQLRLEGRCTFATVPHGWHRRGILPVRWTRRRTLAEEHHWRAHCAGQPTVEPDHPPAPHVWRTGPGHPDADLTPDPEDVSATYRQLRKAFEDGKNEPGASDFYYGEMEMRRHDRRDDGTGTPPGERGLLHAYWLLSGYGLRASRALTWLLAAMSLTVLLLMLWGLPAEGPKQKATGTVPAGGGKVTFVIDKDDPKNPTRDRLTVKRFDKALSVTLNSVVFRSSGQDLTTAGTYIEMASRLLEPSLLALAVLAVRGRVKR
ncbi:pentapeptide repeat-containing protein [Streptomyces sp. NRRL S-237]|uniref:pentapeptide repeat-containing protein n=1 Tax=Streptomyces sp. NRRL S-237 TaxID=1463895 RepID=UPI0007C57C7A|nr:pentapeptide repeat-containing protein [Streptomyces sp. NRRL S-237]